MFLDNGGSVGYGFIFLATLLEFLGLPAPGGLPVALAAASLALGKLGLILPGEMTTRSPRWAAHFEVPLCLTLFKI